MKIWAVNLLVYTMKRLQYSLNRDYRNFSHYMSYCQNTYSTSVFSTKHLHWTVKYACWQQDTQLPIEHTCTMILDWSRYTIPPDLLYTWPLHLQGMQMRVFRLIFGSPRENLHLYYKVERVCKCLYHFFSVRCLTRYSTG